jgi:hypothetical protein
MEESDRREQIELALLPGARVRAAVATARATAVAEHFATSHRDPRGGGVVYLALAALPGRAAGQGSSPAARPHRRWPG